MGLKKCVNKLCYTSLGAIMSQRKQLVDDYLVEKLIASDLEFLPKLYDLKNSVTLT
jgi:hypothetical protein